MNPHALFIIITSLATGTITVFLSHHWILAWIGLEINTLAIIPLMTKTPHPRAIEAATKYFLIQAAASATILFSSTINAWLTGEWAINSLSHPTANIILTLALAMKLGLAPLHFWLPEVLQGLTLQTGLILSTWQKLAPMALLIQLTDTANLTLLMTIGVISTLLGGWGGINQTQLRKIMAFSSIAHIGWMISVLKLAPNLSLLNLLIYLLMTTAMFTALITLSTKKISDLAMAWPKTPTLTALSMLTLLSLGGLPPLSGFMPKWLIAQELIKQNLTAFATIILLSTLLSLFFYLRLSYIMTLTLAPSPSLSPSSWPLTNPTHAAPLITTALALIPLTPTLLILIP
uniref:NADH-ubiquinone oxidoreductase chain 2 n=1 Tax=Uperoleia glandulosa TaxID=1104370 RepID=I3Y258_9NEOB|nr:NADH dehydrogenase subunit 2 [Uperoleia glandulosa]AFL70334.1 NADH dehydrogenase subunit 2 [Uperoleia glandulosa]AFL70349.1 NADH dehydrogenase subunit 2 [Uperoleia glandulosa]